MSLTFPASAHDFMNYSWEDIAPFYNALQEAPLNETTLDEWLKDWSRLSELVREAANRMAVATTLDTTDTEAEEKWFNFLDNIYPQLKAADTKITRKFIDSGLEPEDFEVPLMRMRADVELFREENIPLQTEEHKLGNEYDKLMGAQTVEWQGEERTLQQLIPLLMDNDRAVREQVWTLASDRQLADREAINTLWAKALDLRMQIAANAGYEGDYRGYRWESMNRFDYTPADCMTFHKAIEEAVVPAATRIYEKRRQQLGVDRLRPWDLNVDPSGKDPLKPFVDGKELETKIAAIFHAVDPELGAHFDDMRAAGLLDLDNRKGKAPGGYCETFPAVRKPFIFMNAVGIHDDVQTMLHEGGHAFHVYETADLKYYAQMDPPMEFAEVASMSMELLAAPYLSENYGGFYSDADAARARIEHLEESILFWPYMAIVDAFQHWVYENPEVAKDAANCDAKWQELEHRFRPGIDWTGLEDAEMTGWHRKLHIHTAPFYYVEYGLAQLGASQVWRNALNNQAQAVKDYRKALALGGIGRLPELFEAAGAKFAFDAQTLGEMVSLMEKTVAELETV